MTNDADKQGQGNENARGKDQDKGEEQGKEQGKKPHRTPDQWTNLINQRIEEAMQNGAFDNLRNKGKRLDASPEPHVPPDMQMANSLLKNNDLAPAWISDRAAVLAAIDKFRAKLRKVSGEFAEAYAEAATPQRREQLDELWQRYLAAWREEVVALNKRILTQNLKQPVVFLEIFQLRLEEEVRKAQQS